MFGEKTQSIRSKRYLLIPIPKNPYYRIGPKKLQDWYRQTKRSIAIARELKSKGAEVSIIILSNFKPKGKPSEIEIYAETFHNLAPELNVQSYKETNDTLGQVERSFELKKEIDAELIFISAWMQYPRVLYLAHGRNARHHGVFGIPQPTFALIDPVCIVLQPIADMLGLSNFFQKIIVHQREKGRIL